MPKGIYPRSEELMKRIKNNLKDGMTGKVQSEESIKKRTEKNKIHFKNNPNMGMKNKEHKKESIELMQNKAKEDNRIKNLEGKEHKGGHTEETRLLQKKLAIESERSKGSKNGMWQGGISFEPYSVDWNISLKKFIRERDKYTCQVCGNYGLEVHHINYNKKDCSQENLINLCSSCHSKTNTNREKWIYFFKNRNGI
jgi:hypothetical protein